jgi:hypothetical protein
VRCDGAAAWTRRIVRTVLRNRNGSRPQFDKSAGTDPAGRFNAGGHGAGSPSVRKGKGADSVSAAGRRFNWNPPEPMTGAATKASDDVRKPQACPGATKPRLITPASATAAAAAGAEPLLGACAADGEVSRAGVVHYPPTRVPPLWDTSRSVSVTPLGACD